MKIDFDGVQAFVVIADLGSFSRAAQHLHMTQTALTRRVQKLEAYLGLKLLDRTTRRVELTPVGREFLPQAHAIVQSLTLEVERLKGVSKHGRGNFTLACVPSMTSHVLPDVIRRYVKKHPENRIRLLDASSNEVRESVLNGQAEIGIAVSGEKHEALSERLLFEDPLVFICRMPHALQHKKSVTWSDMREADLIAVSSFMATRMVMDYQLSKRGISVQGNFEVQHHATAINLVAAGVGDAILPSSTFRMGDRPQVCKVPIVNPSVKRKMVLLQRKNLTLSPAAQAFVDLLEKAKLKVD